MEQQSQAGIDVLDQLTALTALVKEQGEEIARLRRAVATVSPYLAGIPTAPETKVGRRGLIAKVAGATAVAALLAVAKEPTTVLADSRTTLTAGGASTTNFGILSTWGNGIDPNAWVPALGVTTHGVIGTHTGAVTAPTRSAGVTGLGGNLDPVVGVQGISNPTFGVYGFSRDASGVRGESNSVTNGAIWGTSASAYGVLGQSNTGAGVFGDSNAAGGYGVFGRSTSGAAIFGTTTGGYAGSFNGPVVINGSLSVTGVKSAVLRHADGFHRRVYCQESPEPWFEDVGRGRLIGGKADIKLDPEFAAVVKTDDYLVFLTEVGDSGGLFVSSQAPTGFSVQARGAAKSLGLVGPAGSGTGGFTYRVMARRKDIAGPRLEKVDLRNVASPIHLPEPFQAADRRAADRQEAAPRRDR